MDIGIQYLAGLVSAVEIEKVEAVARKNNLDFKAKDISGTPFNSIDPALLFVLISPQLLQSISDGMISSVTYDAIKHIAKTLADQISGKKLTMLGGRKAEETTAKLYLRTSSSELRIELPANDLEGIDKAIKKLVKAHVKISKKDS